jgi:hypothetical protein
VSASSVGHSKKVSKAWKVERREEAQKILRDALAYINIAGRWAKQVQIEVKEEAKKN